MAKTCSPDNPVHSVQRNLRGCRNEFPSLSRVKEGRPLVYLDGPAGTQVPEMVIQRITGYYRESNANTHGFFEASSETDMILERAREMTAHFLGAGSANNISFGANMTSLAYALSHAFSRRFKPGDEVLITQLDHEANRGPWLALEKFGIKVKEAVITPEGSLDYDDLAAKITPATRMVAVGWASNALGTVNDIPLVRKLTKEVNAWLLVDAVHYAPHFPIDVNAMEVDFLLCSAYKFYGPHIGILYSREGILDSLETDFLRTQDPSAPYRIETGTLNHASIAGVAAAIEFIASFGKGNHWRERLVHAMQSIGNHEHTLAIQLYKGLCALPGFRIHGPEFMKGKRTPTLSFTLDGQPADRVASSLAKQGICCWSGHFYAIRPVEVLGLLSTGGLVRMGVSMYNTKEEIERTLSVLETLSI